MTDKTEMSDAEALAKVDEAVAVLYLLSKEKRDALRESRDHIASRLRAVDAQQPARGGEGIGWDEQAYAAMRSDLEEWKRRALTAENDLQRLYDDFNAENAPTFMGEPALKDWECDCGNENGFHKLQCRRFRPKHTPSAQVRTEQPAAEGRRFRGIGELERTGYIPAGSAAEREAQQPARKLFMADMVRNESMPGTREAEMVVLETDANGKPTIWCDSEIADLVRALNTGGLRTVASCSGHGESVGNVILNDGRALLIFPDWGSARKAIDIKAQPAPVERCLRCGAVRRDYPCCPIPDQQPTIVVTDAMVERGCRQRAFREDGAQWPDAYSDNEVLAERVLMREFLTFVLAAQQPARGGEAAHRVCRCTELEGCTAACDRGTSPYRLAIEEARSIPASSRQSTLDWIIRRASEIAVNTQPRTEQPAAEVLDLLAVIHRDGGHYTDEHGIAKSASDAEKVIQGMRKAAAEGPGEVGERFDVLRRIWIRSAPAQPRTEKK